MFNVIGAPIVQRTTGVQVYMYRYSILKFYKYNKRVEIYCEIVQSFLSFVVLCSSFSKEPVHVLHYIALFFYYTMWYM